MSKDAKGQHKSKKPLVELTPFFLHAWTNNCVMIIWSAEHLSTLYPIYSLIDQLPQGEEEGTVGGGREGGREEEEEKEVMMTNQGLSRHEDKHPVQDKHSG